jgi:hypothetical protein
VFKAPLFLTSSLHITSVIERTPTDHMVPMYSTMLYRYSMIYDTLRVPRTRSYRNLIPIADYLRAEIKSFSARARVPSLTHHSNIVPLQVYHVVVQSVRSSCRYTCPQSMQAIARPLRSRDSRLFFQSKDTLNDTSPTIRSSTAAGTGVSLSGPYLPGRPALSLLYQVTSYKRIQSIIFGHKCGLGVGIG